MLQDIKKSFNSILYDRVTSPFYGTLIVSWAIWNWKIIYITIFVSENMLATDKITYIVEHFSNICSLVYYPLISTALLLTIMQFVSNGAYWLNLKFTKWKKDQKNKIEKAQLLTLEQSIALREQIAEQEKRYEKLIESKETEIKTQQLINEERLKEIEKNKKEYDQDIVKYLDQIGEKNLRIKEQDTKITTLENKLGIKRENTVASIFASDFLNDFLKKHKTNINEEQLSFFEGFINRLNAIPDEKRLYLDIIKSIQTKEDMNNVQAKYPDNFKRLIEVGIIEQDKNNEYSLSQIGKLFLENNALEP